MIPANLWTLAPWKYYQQTSNQTRIKSINKLSLKPFCFKVMTIFVTHSHCFTTFRKRLVAKVLLKHNSSCLKVIVVESQLEIKYSWSNGCYNIKLALSFLPWLTISGSYLFISCMLLKPQKCFIKDFKHCTSLY